MARKNRRKKRECAEQFDRFEHEEQEIQQTIDDPFWRRNSRSADDYIKDGYERVVVCGLQVWQKTSERGIR